MVADAVTAAVALDARNVVIIAVEAVVDAVAATQ